MEKAEKLIIAQLQYPYFKGAAHFATETFVQDLPIRIRVVLQVLLQHVV